MRSLIGTVLLAASAVVVAPIAIGGASAADEVCASESYGWSGNRLFVPWASTFATGVVIPAPGAGQTLRVTSATYTTYDRYEPTWVPNRAEAGQLNERVGIVIGGTSVGSLSADVPNGVSEGAPNDYFSGNISGSFGGAGTPISGGELVVRHASLYGFQESPNSVFVSQVDVTVERCTTPPTTQPTVTEPTVTTQPTATTQPAATTTTTQPTATTQPAATTTTEVASGGPTTTVTPTTVTPTTATTPTTAAPTTVPPSVSPTTQVASGGPTTTVAGAAGPTTTPAPALPVTGGNVTLQLVIAALMAIVGTAMLVVRRPSAES